MPKKAPVKASKKPQKKTYTRKEFVNRSEKASDSEMKNILSKNN